MFGKKKKEKELDINTMIKEMDLASLVKLRERIESEFLDRNIFIDNDGCLTIKLKDPSSSRDVNFLIDHNNTMMGIDRYNNFYIGKLASDYSMYLIRFSSTCPFPLCFQGSLDVETRSMNGGWYEERLIGQLVVKMQNVDSDRDLTKDLPDDKLEYLNVLITDSYEQVMRSGWTSENYRDLITEIKNMKGNTLMRPQEKRIGKIEK